MARDANSTTLITEAAVSESKCQTCQSCAHAQSESRILQLPLQLPGSYQGEVELSFSLSSLCYVLFHSWLLPIVTALIFAFIADSIPLGEIYGIILAVCGFSVGVLLCRKSKSSALAVKEVL